MISLFSTDLNVLLLAQTAVAAAAGVIVGTLHSYCLWRIVRLLATGGSAVRALAFQLLRLAVVSAILWLIATQGALPLLAAALGMLVARSVMTRTLGAGS